MNAPYRCGYGLSECTCPRTGPVALSPAAMQARHEASVERARMSGWSWQAPTGRPSKPRSSKRMPGLTSLETLTVEVGRNTRRAS